MAAPAQSWCADPQRRSHFVDKTASATAVTEVSCPADRDYQAVVIREVTSQRRWLLIADRLAVVIPTSLSCRPSDGVRSFDHHAEPDLWRTGGREGNPLSGPNIRDSTCA